MEQNLVLLAIPTNSPTKQNYRQILSATMRKIKQVQSVK